MLSVLRVVLRRQSEEEGGPVPKSRLEPDAAAMLLGDTLDDGQTYAGSRIGIAVYAFEHRKDTFVIPRIDPHTVVTETKEPTMVLGDSGNADLRPAIAAKLNRVVDEGAKGISHLAEIAVH